MLGGEDYRCKATACVIQAETMRDPHERASILAIAQLYLKLAERIAADFSKALRPEPYHGAQARTGEHVAKY
jgi:hypothetical protein